MFFYFKFSGRNLAPVQPRSQVLSSNQGHGAALFLSVSGSAVSTSNQSMPRGPQQCDIPCEQPYENVDRADFNYDYASQDGPLRNNGEERVDPDKTGYYVNERRDTGKRDTDDEAIGARDTEEGGRQNEGYEGESPNAEDRDTQGQPLYELPIYSHQYENPEQFERHQYECPSLMDMKAGIAGKTGACAEDGGYTPLERSLSNKNESENVGYTPLNNDEKRCDETGTTAKDDKAANNDDAPDGDYSPTEKLPLNNNESEYVGDNPLINDEKRSDEARTTVNDDKAANNDDAPDGDYSPTEKLPLNNNESEYVGDNPLINDEKRSDEARTTVNDDKAAKNDDALNSDYAPPERQSSEENDKRDY